MGHKKIALPNGHQAPMAPSGRWQNPTGVFQAAAGLVDPPPPPAPPPWLAKNGWGGVWPKSRKMKKKRPHLGSLWVQAIPF